MTMHTQFQIQSRKSGRFNWETFLYTDGPDNKAKATLAAIQAKDAELGYSSAYRIVKITEEVIFET
jgi:hypothetical protein